MGRRMNPLDEKILAKRLQWQRPETAEADILYERRVADEFGVYGIKTNDTLSEIAERFEVGVDDLVRWNKIENPDVIYFGTCLFIRNHKYAHA